MSPRTNICVVTIFELELSLRGKAPETRITEEVLNIILKTDICILAFAALNFTILSVEFLESIKC